MVIELNEILKQADTFSFSDQEIAMLLNKPEKVIKLVRKMFRDEESAEVIEQVFVRERIYTHDEIKNIVNTCTEGLSIEGVSLIGSYARNEQTPASDIDILILDSDYLENESDYTEFEKRLNNAFDIPVDILYYEAVKKSCFKDNFLSKVAHLYGKRI